MRVGSAGAGWRRLASVAAACLGMGAASCAQPPVVRASSQQLYTRAAFELSCHPSMVRVMSLGDGVRGVTGCGQQLVYVERCELLDGTRQCMWVLDSGGPVPRMRGARGASTTPPRPWVNSPVLPPTGATATAGSERPQDVLDDRK